MFEVFALLCFIFLIVNKMWSNIFEWVCFLKQIFIRLVQEREGKIIREKRKLSQQREREMVTGCVDLDQYQSLKAADSSVPIPPPVPSKSDKRHGGNDVAEGLGNSGVSTATRDMWDRLFNDGYKADVVIYTDNGGVVYAHSNIIVSENRI